MKHRLKAAITILAMFALICTFTFAASAAVDGISVSDTALSAGESFIINVNIPAIRENADTVSIRVEFDPNVFDIVTWEPELVNEVHNSGNGFFVVTSANATRTIDLSRGLTLQAFAQVKQSVPTGNYYFRLVNSSISYVTDNGYDYAELWYPSVTSVSVRVNGDTAYNGEQITVSAITVPDDDIDPFDDEYIDDGDEDNSGNAYEEPLYDDDDDPYEEEAEEEDPYDPEEYSGNGGIEIMLDSRLTGLTEGNIRLSTKKEFFSGDTVVRLTGTTDAAENASYAAQNLGLSGNRSYAFDISLYDTMYGEQIHTLGDGYIELAIPVPRTFGRSIDSLEVYRTAGGYPRKIASSIEYDGATARIVFRANDFSPYMIIDASDVTIDDPQIITPYNNSGANSSGRPINPRTGVAAAIIIPTSLVGCVLLARSTTGRKRSKKYKGTEDEEDK